jgi:hypothetical protein
MREGAYSGQLGMTPAAHAYALDRLGEAHSGDREHLVPARHVRTSSPSARHDCRRPWWQRRVLHPPAYVHDGTARLENVRGRAALLQREPERDAHSLTAVPGAANGTCRLVFGRQRRMRAQHADVVAADHYRDWSHRNWRGRVALIRLAFTVAATLAP